MLSKRGPPAASEQPAPKRKRPDVAARLQDREHQKFATVRVKLHGLLTPLGKQLHWRDLIEQATKGWFHAHRLANEVVSQHCIRGLAVPRLDNSFFYGCLAAVCKGKKSKGLAPDATEAKKVFAECAADHRSICSSGQYVLPDLKQLSGFKQYASQMMATNAEV